MHKNRKYRDGRACKSCGNKFVPVRSSVNAKTLVYDSANQRRFCKPDCHDGRRVKVWQGSTCKNCGIQFTKILWPKAQEPFARPIDATNCSNECYIEERRQAGLEQAKTFPGSPVYTCKNCGGEFQRRNKRGTEPVYCSRACHQMGMKRRLPAGNPPGTHRRMRKQWPMNVNNKARTRKILRERDGDACHICGDPINFEAPATHPDSCTIDHVIPVAAGGDSRLDNLKLAHWHCNCIVKNDKIFDETTEIDYIRPHD